MNADFSAMFVSEAEAQAAGFAGFNSLPHLCVDVPDGGLTVSVRTSEGKRVTFCLVPTSGEIPAPGCVDIQFHDSPVPKIQKRDQKFPVMHSIGFGVEANTWDTREHAIRTTFMTVLLADSYYRETGTT